MITCIFWNGSRCVIPHIEGETIRQLSLRLMRVRGTIGRRLTCPYIIYHNGRVLNRSDKRHDLVEADVRYIFAIPKSQFSCNLSAMLTGNLRSDMFLPDLDHCAICLEDFTSRTSVSRLTFYSLPCDHRFHTTCLAAQMNPECAVCRRPIPESVIRRCRMI